MFTCGLKKLKKKEKNNAKETRSFLAQVALREKRLAAAKVIRGLILGFIHRFEAYGEINKVFLRKMYETYLNTLAKTKLPTSIFDDSWPAFHPKPVNNVSLSFIYFFTFFCFASLFTYL